MKKIKKTLFENINPGQKFRYKRKIWVKDKHHVAVSFTTGKVIEPLGDFVTPIKVKIVEAK